MQELTFSVLWKQDALCENGNSISSAGLVRGERGENTHLSSILVSFSCYNVTLELLCCGWLFIAADFYNFVATVVWMQDILLTFREITSGVLKKNRRKKKTNSQGPSLNSIT